jgi:hypothetical protein
MAVVINEFEVVPEAPAKTRSGSSSDSQGSEGSTPQQMEQEVKRVLEMQMERCERVRAH